MYDAIATVEFIVELNRVVTTGHILVEVFGAVDYIFVASRVVGAMVAVCRLVLRFQRLSGKRSVRRQKCPRTVLAQSL